MLMENEQFMQIKKQAYEQLKKYFDSEVSSLGYELMKNKREINTLAEKQKVIKFKLQRLYEFRKQLPKKV